MTAEKNGLLPEYTIRYSARAKRIGLRVVPSRGLEVVLPEGVDPSCVPPIVARYSKWAERALEKMGIDPARENGTYLPRFFFVKGGAERIILDDPTGRNAVFGDLPTGVLDGALPGPHGIPGNIPVVDRRLALPSAVTREGARDGLGLAWLRGWVKEEAKAYLVPRLEELANRHGFQYQGVGIRAQRTRWGSCSAKGRLNLNACLLFLPEKLTRYILLHELCHTRQMNHGEGFWKLFYSVEPGAVDLDRLMRKAWQHVPSWFLG